MTGLLGLPECRTPKPVADFEGYGWTAEASYWTSKADKGVVLLRRGDAWAAGRWVGEDTLISVCRDEAGAMRTLKEYAAGIEISLPPALDEGGGT